MIRKFFIGISILGSLTAVAPGTQAEIIEIPVGQQSAELADTKRPLTGATEQQVIAQFGEPLSKKEARGTPPISSWEYPDFVVYFENDHVIHSVLKHRPYVD